MSIDKVGYLFVCIVEAFVYFAVAAPRVRHLDDIDICEPVLDIDWPSEGSYDRISWLAIPYEALYVQCPVDECTDLHNSTIYVLQIVSTAVGTCPRSDLI